MYVHKCLNVSMYSTFAHNHQSLGTAEVPFSWWMDTLPCANGGPPPRNRKKRTEDSCGNVGVLSDALRSAVREARCERPHVI